MLTLSAAALLIIALPKPLLFPTPASYLPTHIALEFVSIATELMVFAVAWNTPGRRQAAPYLVLGCAMLASVLFSLAHTLSYDGMPAWVTPSSPEKAINFWLAGRLASGVGLLAVATMHWQPFARRRYAFASIAAAIVLPLVLAWIFLYRPDWVPRTFIPGEGLTSFKKLAEAFTITLHAVAAALLWQRATPVAAADLRNLAAAAWTLALAGLFFLLYSEVTDLYNLSGHVYRLIGAMLLYRCVFVHGVKRPYDQLHETEQALESLVNTTHGILWEADARTLETRFVSLSAERILGYPPGHWYRPGFYLERVHPADRGAFLQQLETVRRQPGPHEVECRMQVQNGDTIWLHHVLSAVFANGEPVLLRGVAVDISERKRLEEQATLFRNLIERTADPVYMLDPEAGFRLHYVNSAAARHFGLSADQLAAVRLPEIDVGLDLERLHRIEREVDERGSVLVETVHRHAGGELVPVEMSMSRFDSGGRRYLTGYIRDIRRRKRAEAALRESEERFRLMADSAPVLLWLADTSKQCTWFNRRWLEFTGRTMEQEVGNGWAEGVHPEDLQRCINTYETAFDAHEPFTMEYRIRRHDGEYRWVLDNGVPRFDAAGEFVGYIGSCVDITERKAGEALVARNEARHRSLISALSEGVVLQGRDGAILIFNEAAQRMLGLSAGQVAGTQQFDPQWRPVREDGSPFPAEMHPSVETLRSGRPVRNTVMGVHRPDGTLTWLSLNTEPLLHAGDPLPYAVVTSFTDITHLKSAEAELRELSERLRLATAAAGIGVWDYSLQSETLVWNDIMFRLYDTRPEEFDGSFQMWRRRVHPEDLPATEEKFRRALLGEADFDTEFRIVRTDGTIRTIKAYAYVERDTNGRSVRILGTNWDISSIKDTARQLSTVVQDLSRHDFEVTVINRMTDLMLSCVSEQEAYPIVGNAGRQLFVAEGVLAVASNGGAGMTVVARWHSHSDDGDSAFRGEECWAVRRGQVHEVTRSGGEPVCAHVKEVPPDGYLCVPLSVRGESLGLLHLSAPPIDGRRANWRHLAESFAEEIKLGLSNLRLRDTLQQQALRDPLTGLYNRRYLEETLPRELHRSLRQQLHLSVALLDIDHFKAVNDTFGHEAGDTVLKHLGAQLQQALRRSDIACRFGGEEFVLVLPETTLADAARRMEAVRCVIADTAIAHEGIVLDAVTVSIGLAEAPTHTESPEQLIRLADAALYQAKHGGRNRVVVAGSETDAAVAPTLAPPVSSPAPS